MKFIALLILGCWLLAWLEIASEGQDSFWTRMIRAAKRRAKEWTE